MAQLVSASIQHIPLGNGASILLSEFDGIWYRDTEGNDYWIGTIRRNFGGFYVRAELGHLVICRAEAESESAAAFRLYEKSIEMAADNMPDLPEWMSVALREAVR